MTTLSVLQKKDSSESLLNPAMTRIAIKQNPEARARLVERLNSNDPKINSSAALSLGYF